MICPREVNALLDQPSRRARRRGQTLVDYCLVLALVTMIGIQEMQLYFQYLGCELIYNKASFVCAEAVAANPSLSGDALDAAVMTAVDNYLGSASTWNGINTNIANEEAKTIHDKIYEGIYGTPDPAG